MNAMYSRPVMRIAPVFKQSELDMPLDLNLEIASDRYS